MKFKFHKYQGAGNDFIVIDDREQLFPTADNVSIAELCNRRFGIGSDGILLVQNSEETDLHVYFLNPDGSRSFCGNGSRCALRFAKGLGMISDSCTFSANDGNHQGRLDEELVHISMRDVDQIVNDAQGLRLYTGSPHLIVFEDEIESIDVENLGADIRNSEPYRAEGINVNFVQELSPDTLAIRTYERGVEAETLACGTGVTAAALAKASKDVSKLSPISVKAQGGELEVSFKKSGNGFSNIWLSGSAVKVFEGAIVL